MAQFQDFVSSPTLTRRGPIHIGRLHAFYLGTILVIGARGRDRPDDEPQRGAAIRRHPGID